MIIVGVDPGKTGGICVLEDGAVRELAVMPEMWIFIEMMRSLASSARKENLHVYLEKAQSMPKQGISSAFNYGCHFGELLGVIQCLGMRHTLVPPRTWSKHLHAGTRDGKPKARSLEAAKRLFPDVNLLATPRSKVAHDGLVDALLVAEYGRRQSS